MKIWSSIHTFLNFAFRRSSVEREMEEEFRAHLRSRADDLEQSGLSRAEAEQQARVEFGGYQRYKEECREALGTRLLAELIADVRFGLRQLRRNPGFTAVAVITLALGIGANTAIFSVIDAVLIHPLPFANSDRLVWAWGKFGNLSQAAVSPADFLDYRTQNHSFTHMGAFFVLGSQPENLVIKGHGEFLQGTMITSGFFETLGARPLIGRTLVPADERVINPRSIILSFGVWQQKFGANPSIIGSTVNFNGAVTDIVGVMPADFDFPPRTEIWFPTPMLNVGMQQRLTRMMRPVGLLKPNVSLQQAQADINLIARRLAGAHPSSDMGWSLLLQPMQDAIVGSVRTPLLILLSAVALVLLIACVNVANLLLARNSTRQKEIAIRTALGASRMQIVRQLVTESLSLSCIGGAVGFFLAGWGVTLLRSLGPMDVPRLAEVQLNESVLAFAAVVSILAGILSGLVPSLQATKSDLTVSLKEGGRSSAGAEHRRLRGSLVVSEVALAMTLLITAGLLLNSLWRMLHVNPGFDPHSIVTSRLSLPVTTYSKVGRRIAFFRDLMEKVRALPGVKAVGIISELPLAGEYNDTYLTTAAAPPKSPIDADDVDDRRIAGRYFQAMRIPLLQGRFFSVQDRHGSPRVMIVDVPFVRRYFPNSHAIGRHVLIYEGSAGFVGCEIVGVVGGIRGFALRVAPRPTVYLPYSQDPNFDMNLVVRSAGNPDQLTSGIQAALASVDPEQPTSAFSTMRKIIAESVAGNRLNTLLLSLFGGIALILAAAGIYGVVSYTVSQRTHEVGIRMALGAQKRDVLRLVVGQGMILALIGVAIGIVGALGLTRFLSSLLYGVKPTDPITFIVVSLILTGVALLACYIPARRAAKVDPMVALRYE